MEVDPQQILREVRERRARRSACAGHEFVPSARGKWECPNCGVPFDAKEIQMYLQGLRHGARGHSLNSDLRREG